jgi:hypothetical protein
MPERRKAKRRPFDHVASIARLEDGRRIADCMIRDLSDSGARLALREAAELPPEFALLLSKSGNVLRRCRLAWKKANEIGVSFVAAPRRR